ncbi:MAG: division/cell wall cluster transcriptional repressor MraZ [Salinivirgaceae bacterium]|nr:division/cell wall cluster transcriptional repressor MraZ [Salinivirgaceae bacterium]
MGRSGKVFVFLPIENCIDMIPFVGEYNVRIDAKGRLVLPSALKKQGDTTELGAVYILKEDMYEQCLVLYPASEWERQNTLIRSKLNPFDRAHNQFLRSFSKGAFEILLDSNNRLLIPKRLLEFAQIDRDVVLSGQDGKIEIWSADMYQQMWSKAPDFEQLAKKVMND